MTFLYKINKKGATAEGCITASDEAEAKAKLDAKFPKGSGVKVLGLEQVYVATIRNTRMSAFKGRPLAGACQGLPASEALKLVEFPTDPILGPTTWNVGDLVSSNPQNILSPETRFRIYFRTTFATDELIQNKLLGASPKGSVIQAFGGDTPMTYFSEVEGIPSKPVSFGSDAPRLEKFARRAICGPGSILTAHTDKEYVLVSDLQKAVEQDIKIFKTVTKETI